MRTNCLVPFAWLRPLFTFSADDNDLRILLPFIRFGLLSDFAVKRAQRPERRADMLPLPCDPAERSSSADHDARVVSTRGVSPRLPQPRPAWRSQRIRAASPK